MHNVDHVEFSLNKIRELFIKASEKVEALEPGGKIPATALAEAIGAEFGLSGPQTYPVLKFLFNNYPGIIVRRGAHGGLIKPLPNQNESKTKSKAKELAPAALATSLATGTSTQTKSFQPTDQDTDDSDLQSDIEPEFDSNLDGLDLES